MRNILYKNRAGSIETLVVPISMLGMNSILDGRYFNIFQQNLSVFHLGFVVVPADLSILLSQSYYTLCFVASIYISGEAYRHWNSSPDLQSVISKAGTASVQFFPNSSIRSALAVFSRSFSAITMLNCLWKPFARSFQYGIIGSNRIAASTLSDRRHAQSVSPVCFFSDDAKSSLGAHESKSVRTLLGTKDVKATKASLNTKDLDSLHKLINVKDCQEKRKWMQVIVWISEHFQYY